MAYDQVLYQTTRNADGSGGIIATPFADIEAIPEPAENAPLSAKVAYLATYGIAFALVVAWVLH